MSSAPTPRPVLSVYLTPHTIEAVLVQSAPTGPQLLQRFVRPRLQVGAESLASDFAASVPGLKSSDDIDFTLQVGGKRFDDDVQFDKTLGSVSFDDTTGDGAPSAAGTDKTGPRTFLPVLAEILDECAQMGVSSPRLVFCAGSPDVHHATVVADPVGGEAEERSWIDAVQFWKSSSESDDRFAALRRVYSGAIDRERTVFLPMTPSATGSPRHLALLPTLQESVTPTLSALFAQESAPDVVAERLDGEIALYVDVVRRQLAPEPSHTSVVVRIDGDDTLALFLTGGELRHVELLRSLTSYDAPDTIASRILLYQDEQQIDQVDGVLIVGGPRDERLTDSFRNAYPKAAVGRLHELLVSEWVDADDAVLTEVTPDSGPALAAALRVLDDTEPLDDDLNLLGSTGRVTKRRLPVFTWATVGMLVLLVLATTFFAWRYVEQNTEIQRLQARVDADPVAMPDLSPAQLRQRVDSLNGVYARNERSLYVLDSLLNGSTEWSETIERTARQTRSIEGVWFEDWSISPSTLVLKGMTLNRGRLAAMARNLRGTVKSIIYSDIDDRRVYSFEIEIPRTTGMPEAAIGLRARSMDASSATQITSTPGSNR